MKKILVALMLFCSPAYAVGDSYGKVTNDEAVRIILGASSDESYSVMYAIACTLRNMNRTDRRPEILAEIDHLPQELKDKALRAWTESRTGYDASEGANDWYNLTINGNYIVDQWKPKWVRKDQFIKQVGRHMLYRR